MATTAVPEIRIQTANELAVNPQGDYVLYWMIANRRTRSNFSLDRAVQWCRELNKPLLILEALRAGYRWASDRIHAFVIQGMVDNASALDGKPVVYYPYLEPAPGNGKGLLRKLAEKSCVVVSDDFPCFFLPHMIDSAARQVPVRLELVDSNGLMPMRATDRVFARAHDFRRYLQKNLRPHLPETPRAAPFRNLKIPVLKKLPAAIQKQWPPADLAALEKDISAVNQFPIDHSVEVVDRVSGGSRAAARQLKRFIKSGLPDYAELRNQPQQDVASGLSPWLHFGHISAHQVFDKVMAWKPWSPESIADKASGSREGWWGAAPEVESFLDELITWREVGYNMCALTDDFDQYESLPAWARETLEQHASDPREYIYSLEEFEAAATHDPLWNAAQNQLVREGRIHNYLRMLWGKKIFEWSPSPRETLEVMIELNNKYALDGRNPNSYSGIFWCLGRYDRAWGPVRPVYGKIRYMSSDNTARKVRVKDYIARYNGDPQQAELGF